MKDRPGSNHSDHSPADLQAPAAAAGMDRRQMILRSAAALAGLSLFGAGVATAQEPSPTASNDVSPTKSNYNTKKTMITLIIFDKRKKGTTHQDYIDHHEQVHAKLFTSLPEVQQHVRRYVQKHPTGDNPPGGADHMADVDGVTEISFDDMAGLNAVFKSENYEKIIVPDEAKFLDRENVKMVVTYENVVVAG